MSSPIPEHLVAETVRRLAAPVGLLDIGRAVLSVETTIRQPARVSLPVGKPRLIPLEVAAERYLRYVRSQPPGER